MSLRDQNLRLALTKAIADTMSAFMGHFRDDHMVTLLESYDDTGNKAFTVRLPDGTKVATITLAEPKESYDVVDEADFLAWVKRHRPDGVETVVVPPVPGYEYEQVKPKVRAALLKSLTHDGDIPFEPKSGEIVDGVAYKPVGRPKSFAVRFEGGDDGRSRLIDAWRTGALQEIAGNDVLPQVGGA